MMKSKGNLYIAIFFLLLGSFGIIHSLTLRYWESMILPLIVSGVIFALALAEAITLFSRYMRQKEVENTGTESIHKSTERRRLASIVIWAMLFMAGVYLLGFYLAIPSITLAYLRKQGRTWPVSIMFSLALLVFIYLVFQFALDTPLYKGLVWEAAARIFD